jgi:hypothetical protein
MNFESFLETLPEDELRRLQSQISNKLGSSKEEPVAHSKPEHVEVFDAISKAVTSNGSRGIPWAVFQTTKDCATLRAKADWFTKFIVNSFKPATKIERAYCFGVVLKLLTAWMERLNISISYRAILNNLDRAPLLLEESFPGYRSAGLLGSLIRQAKH